MKSFQVVLIGVALVLLAAGLGRGQRSGVPESGGVPEDWSHHHLVFAAPRTAAEAVEQQRDPRFWHQWFRRNTAHADVAPGGSEALSAWPPISIAESRRRRGPEGLGGLWFQTLAAGATVG